MILEKVKNHEREDLFIDEVIESNDDIDAKEKREVYEIIATEVLDIPVLF